MVEDEDAKNENESADDTENPEGEGVEGEEGEDGEENKSSKKKLIILIAVPLVLLIGVGAAAYFTGMLDSLLGKDAAMEEVHDGDGEHDKKDKKKDKKKAKKGDDGHGEDGEYSNESAFVAIPPMIVNLNAEDGASRFLRLSVQLELADASEKEAVEAVMPRVIDQFQTYLRELRVSDLRGSAGIYRLQMELLWRVNQAAYPVEVKSVLFQEILIQ